MSNDREQQDRNQHVAGDGKPDNAAPAAKLEVGAAQQPDPTEVTSAFVFLGDADEKATNPGVTAAFTPSRSRSGSRGLQIRCPHCSNHVEVLVDTPYEEISCSSCGSSFSLVDREEHTKGAVPLRSIGRFELVSRLGVGGFGSVWKARDVELDRVVAIKIPRRGQLTPDEIQQFFREARAAAQLRHPNIVPVHEVGRDGETIFIVCDLVRGVELSAWLDAKRPHALEAATLCKKIALALHHAHEHSVIHRDLKPSNVMIDLEGEPHLMDFGLAKREIGEITMTVDGQILGTPAYMSPEQAAGHSHWTDRRTDIYSLGVILFRLLTSELPFRGNAQMQVHQRLTEDPPDPRKLNRHAPKDLATICLKCLERDPNRRYATAQALADEFDRFLRGDPILARPLSPPARLARWAKRKPALATIAALVLFLSIAGPLAALRIEMQRRRLEELVGEKNNLIDRYANDKQADAARNAALSKQLDLWEGKINPWKFWPPRADEPPRQNLLKGLYQRRFQTVAAQLQDGSLKDGEAACGHLALAMLADEMGHSADAEAHLLSAKDVLTELSQQHPDNPAYSEALAGCYMGLAQLASADSPANRETYVQKASKILDQLAVGSKDGANYRIERLDAELHGAVAAGFADATRHLTEATRLAKELDDNWPSDPVRLYQLVCLLSRQEPVLIPRATAGAPAPSQP